MTHLKPPQLRAFLTHQFPIMLDLTSTNSILPYLPCPCAKKPGSDPFPLSIFELWIPSVPYNGCAKRPGIFLFIFILTFLHFPPINIHNNIQSTIIFMLKCSLF